MLLGVTDRVPMWSQLNLQILLSLCDLVLGYYIIIVFFVIILIIRLLRLKQYRSFFIFYIYLGARSLFCTLLMVVMMMVMMLMMSMLKDRRLIFFIFGISILKIFTVFLMKIRWEYFCISCNLVLRMLSNQICYCRIELRIIDPSRAEIILSRWILLRWLISQPKNLWR